MSKNTKSPEGRAKRAERTQKAIFWCITLTYLGTILFLVIQLFTLGQGGVDESSGRTAPEYVMMLVQCLIGLALMFLPSLLGRRFSVRLPYKYYIVYVIFLYYAIYLGEVRDYFYRFAHWDTMLHCFSGIALGGIGFTLVFLLNTDPNVRMSLSPFFVAFFAFCFAVALGGIWEIVEFTVDGVMGVNMQKFALEGGALLVGREALLDTMQDLIVDSLGALASSVMGYLTIIRDRTGSGDESK